MSGHLYVVQADLRLLDCDAWLLPTDRTLWVTEGWGTDLITEVATRDRPDSWGESVRATRLNTISETPQIWIGDTGGSGGRSFDWYRTALDQKDDDQLLREAVPLPPPSHSPLATKRLGSGLKKIERTPT